MAIRPIAALTNRKLNETTHMIILLYGFGVLLAGASVITVYAALTAKDGYEDETGFHLLRTAHEAADGSDKKSVGSDLPPFAPAS